MKNQPRRDLAIIGHNFDLKPFDVFEIDNPRTKKRNPVRVIEVVIMEIFLNRRFLDSKFTVVQLDTEYIELCNDDQLTAFAQRFGYDKWDDLLMCAGKNNAGLIQSSADLQCKVIKF
jgi:hypothetical protein